VIPARRLLLYTVNEKRGGESASLRQHDSHFVHIASPWSYPNAARMLKCPGYHCFPDSSRYIDKVGHEPRFKIGESQRISSPLYVSQSSVCAASGSRGAHGCPSWAGPAVSRVLCQELRGKLTHLRRAVLFPVAERCVCGELGVSLCLRALSQQWTLGSGFLSIHRRLLWSGPAESEVTPDGWRWSWGVPALHMR